MQRSRLERVKRLRLRLRLRLRRLRSSSLSRASTISTQLATGNSQFQSSRVLLRDLKVSCTPGGLLPPSSSVIPILLCRWGRKRNSF